MSVLTSTVSVTVLDRLFRVVEICNHCLQGRPAHVPDRAADPTLTVRRLLADAVMEIAKLKWLIREGAYAARGLRAQLSEAKAENASLRRELIDVRAQAIALRLNLFDADQRLAAGHCGGTQAPRDGSSLGEATAALVELKRIFAKRYHPNSISNAPRERAVRAELFKEFWGDIAMIEAKYDRRRLAPEDSNCT